MSEEAWGFFWANEIHAFSPNIYYRLLFTPTKLVGAKGRKEVFPVKASKLNKELEKASEGGEKVSTESILMADKGNFEIPYSTITKIEIRKSPIGLAWFRTGKISIFTIGKKKYKFDIVYGQKFEEVVRLVRSALPDKLSIGL